MTKETASTPTSDCAKNLGIGDASERARQLATALNKSCFCITLDRIAMADAMGTASGQSDFYDAHVVSRTHLFSNVPVFLPDADRSAMLAVVEAIETIAHTPAYRDAVLAWAPKTSARDFGPLGALMGYDFHLGAGPPRLIEINTNAGGAFLNAFSARAQQACCAEAEAAKRGELASRFESAAIEMFEAEWLRQRGGGRPQRIAIVDDAPEGQYLYPEFILAQRLFETHGIKALIADPADLIYADGELRVGEEPVDLVYNRLVDFALIEPRHRALRQAWLDRAAVVTPNPHTHALFADKRNLTVLSDGALLRAWGASEATISALSILPHAVQVTSANADELWAARKRLFFKPVAGHGGKAVYRGDKLTRAVWTNILGSDYIAQDLAPPGDRQIMLDGVATPRKVDVRLYTYAGGLLLAAARLYQGQTTNFRSEGGGFAPVYFL